MGKNAYFVSHKKSKLKENGGPKLPLATDLVEGEIAINFAENVETLSIKNESGDVVTFSSDNYYTEKKLGSGFTGENSANTVTSVVGSGFTSSSITDVIIENEEIISAALNDLDERKLDASAYTPSAAGLWVSGTGLNSVVQNGSSGTASGNYAVAEGSQTQAIGNYSHAEGGQFEQDGVVIMPAPIANGDYSHVEGMGTTTPASGMASHAEGIQTQANGMYSHAEGGMAQANGSGSHAEGFSTVANNQSEHASGQYNVSSSASTTFGDSGNTLFSVGNGTADNARHNAFEIRQNGDVYITSGNSDIKLQDYIGGGGSITVDQVIDSGTSASTNAVATKAVVDKLIEDEQVWALALNELNSNKFGYANFDNTDNTLYFYKNEGDYTSGGTAIDSVDLSDISIDIDQVIDSGTSASTNAVATKAVYGFVTSYTPSITVDQDFSNSASTNPISTKAVYSAMTENELVWANTFVALSGTVSAHTANTEIHVTAADKARWNSGSDSLWTSGSGVNSVVLKGSSGTASGDYAVAEGHSYEYNGDTYTSIASGSYSHTEGSGTKASGDWGSHAEGDGTVASGESSHAEGYETKANGDYSHAEGTYAEANGSRSHAEGYYTITNNESEHASGQYNVSNSASTTFGDSGNTLFSVGNGTNTNARHNAFEIRQNGDIYITSGSSDIKLQDYIGSVETVTAITPSNSGSTDPIATKVVAENELTVSNALNDLNTNKADKTSDLDGLKLKKITQAAYDALAVKDPNTLYVIVN